MAGKREHYAANRDYFATKNAQWIRANPQANRARARRRRRTKLGAKGSHTLREWLDLLASYEGRCLRCGTTETVGPDHVIPLTKGGTDNLANLQPLCRNCNSSKGNRIMDYRPNQTPVGRQLQLDF